MRRRQYLWAAFDGVIQALTFDFLGQFTISVFAVGLQLGQFLLLGVLMAFVSGFIYFLFLKKESKNQTIVIFSLFDIFSFLIASGILFIFHLATPYAIFPLTETNNVDGIVILFTQGCFVLTVVLLKFLIFITLLCKNGRWRGSE